MTGTDDRLAEIESTAEFGATPRETKWLCSQLRDAQAEARTYQELYEQRMETLVKAEGEIAQLRDELALEPVRTAIEYDHWKDAAIANRNEADALHAELAEARAALADAQALDHGRLIGTEDAYKAVLRLVRSLGGNDRSSSE